MRDLKSRWLTALTRLHITSIESVWEMADLLLVGVDDLTDGSPDEVADLLGEVSEQLEVAVKTLRNYMRVARRFPPDIRLGPPLTLGHHEVVARFEDNAEALDWLHKAWAGGWSVARLRLEVNIGDDENGAPSPLHGRLAAGGVFAQLGLRASIGKKKGKIELPDGKHLIFESSEEIKWYLSE